MYNPTVGSKTVLDETITIFYLPDEFQYCNRARVKKHRTPSVQWLNWSNDQTCHKFHCRDEN